MGGDNLGQLEKWYASLADDPFTWHWVASGSQKAAFTLSVQGGSETDALRDTLTIHSGTIDRWISEPFILTQSSERFASTTTPGSYSIELSTLPIWSLLRSLPVILDVEQPSTLYWSSRLYLAALTNAIGRRYPEVARWYAETPMNEILRSQQVSGDPDRGLLHDEHGKSPWETRAEQGVERIKQIRRWLNPISCQQELELCRRKLFDLQLSDGSWPWFEGMHGDLFITQLVLQRMGDLKKLNIANFERHPQSGFLIKRSVAYLDGWMRKSYLELLKMDPDLSSKIQLNPLLIHQLYTRSFYEGIQMEPANEIAFLHFSQRFDEEWQHHPVMLQALMAFSAWQNGKFETYSRISRSLNERLMKGSYGELHLSRQGRSGSWIHWDLLLHSRLIELFSLEEASHSSLPGLRLYLLKQKRTLDWGDAYDAALASKAMLLEGSGFSTTPSRVNLEIEGTPFKPLRIEMGSTHPQGYYHYEWQAGGDKKPVVQASLASGDMVWGALHRFETVQVGDLDETAGQLRLSRKILVKSLHGSFRELPEGEAVKPGTSLFIQLTIETDEDLSYVRLEDFHAAGFKPGNFQSGYRHNRDLSFYQSGEENSVVFYIPVVTRGTHQIIFEVIPEQAGRLFGGYARIQSVFAPEFSAWSSSRRIVVEETTQTGASSTVK